MASSHPRLTVLIPTRDRCETLGSTISSCLDQNYDNLRVVVSDNLSNDETADVIASFSDPRLSCIRPDRRLSMTGNFEFSLGAVTEGYVMHVGDDDGLLPGGVEQVASIIGETGAPAVTSQHAIYDCPNSLFEDRRNILTLPIASGFELRDCRKIAKQVADFRINYPNLPGTYVSFVNTDVICRVRRGGRYYRSITPDCYSGFADAAEIGTFAFANRPFALSGVSGRSNGASQIIATDPTEAAKYKSENDLPFHPQLIYCPQSVEIVVAECFLQAQEQVGSVHGVALNIERLMHVALREANAANYPFVRNAVIEIARLNGLRVDPPGTKSPMLAFEAMMVKFAGRIGRLRQGYRRFDCNPKGARTIYDACRIAAEILGPA